MWNKFEKNEKGFTGLEAAIVLIAFVVVAAVFSYVMLGAGFFTTQKSQEVVHKGVTQASSSVELSGDVIALADGTVTTKIKNIDLFLQLTSGGSPVDLNRTLIVFSAPGVPPTDLKLNVDDDGVLVITPDATHFALADAFNDNGDLLIDRGEKFDVQIDIDTVAAAVTNPDVTFTANSEFQVEIKPPEGATYTIHRSAPPSIRAVMSLV